MMRTAEAGGPIMLMFSGWSDRDLFNYYGQVIESHKYYETIRVLRTYAFSGDFNKKRIQPYS